MKRGLIFLDGPDGGATVDEWERVFRDLPNDVALFRIRDPDPTGRLIASAAGSQKLAFAVLLSPTLDNLPELSAEFASAAKLDSLNVEFVPTSWIRLLGRDLTSNRRIKQLVQEMIIEARDARELPIAHRKMSYGPSKAAVSRRGLFRSLVRPRTVLVPVIDRDRCGARNGCTGCVDVCPTQAISLRREGGRIDGSACIACGLCFPACPAEAIAYPPLGTDVLTARLRTMHSGEDGRKNRLIFASVAAIDALESGRKGRTLGEDVQWVPVPCAAAIAPSVVVAALRLGAQAAALLTCPPTSTCSKKDSILGTNTAAEARTLLEAAGFSGHSLSAVPSGPDASATFDALTNILEMPIQPPSVPVHLEPVASMRLGEEARRILAKLTNPVPRLSDPRLHLGEVQVKADACTLCGLCAAACPTRALEMERNDDKTALTFDHAACVACSWCLDVCPEDALTVSKVMDPERLLGGRRLVAESKEARCLACHVSLGPDALVLRMHVQMEKKFAGLVRGQFCPECRMKQGFSNSSIVPTGT